MNSTLPSSPIDPLAHLHDIHLPTAIGLWPLAWGWWALCIFILVALFSSIFFVRRFKTRNGYRAFALTELKKISQQYSSDQNAEYLQALALLLRRTAISAFGQKFNASMTGEEWLLWLDAQYTKNSTDFSAGVGRVLRLGQYQKNPEFNRAALHALAYLWVKQHRNQWHKNKKNTTHSQGANAHV
jgi:hypothetical protein